MIEIAHDHLEATILLADQIRRWHFDIIESDVSGTAGPDTTAFHLPGGYTRHRLFHEQKTQAFHAVLGRTCSDSVCEIVCKNAVGNPLLLSIDDIVVSIFHCGGLQICNIGAS